MVGIIYFFLKKKYDKFDIKQNNRLIDYLLKELDLEESLNYEILVVEGEPVYKMDR